MTGYIVLSDIEGLLACGFFPFDVDGVDFGKPRPPLAPIDHRFDRLPASLEDGLNSPVWQVSDPARDAARSRSIFGFLTEEHALNLARDEDVSSRSFPSLSHFR